MESSSRRSNVGVDCVGGIMIVMTHGNDVSV